MEVTFGKAVEVILKNWNPLQFAVDQRMGGIETKAKEEWFIKVVEDFFYKNDDLDPDEVADFISPIMDREFNTLIEDDSDLEVSVILCRFFRFSQANETDKILEELNKMPKVNLASCMVQEPEDDDMDESPEEVATQLTELQIDGEDGESEMNGHRELTELEKQQAQDEADGWCIQRHEKKRRQKLAAKLK